MTKAEMAQRMDALDRYVSDLRRRHDRAVRELAELAQGVGTKPHWFTPQHDWLEAVKFKAGRAVEEIAKMPLREAP